MNLLVAMPNNYTQANDKWASSEVTVLSHLTMVAFIQWGSKWSGVLSLRLFYSVTTMEITHPEEWTLGNTLLISTIGSPFNWNYIPSVAAWFDRSHSLRMRPVYIISIAVKQLWALHISILEITKSPEQHEYIMYPVVIVSYEGKMLPHEATLKSSGSGHR